MGLSVNIEICLLVDLKCLSHMTTTTINSYVPVWIMVFLTWLAKLNIVFPAEPPPPDPVSCKATEATVLTVTWSTPESICEITQYNVDYHGQVLWSNNTDLGQPASSKNTLIDLTHLVPWTHYKVCVETEIIGGLVGNQSCCDATTKQAGK